MSKRFLVTVSVLWMALGGFALAAEQPPDQSAGYDPKGKRDPFVPLVREGRIVSVASDGHESAPTVDFSSPVLLGIVWDPNGHSIALINDTEAKVGDVLGDYRVDEIRKDAVVLMRDGEPLVLTITFEDSGPKKKSQKLKGGEGP